MHVHPPKPLHGWREFLGEVGIIVIGVLIALGAEHLVERHRWREEAAAARESLNEEVYYSLVDGRERAILQGCLDRQLDRTDELIDADARRVENIYTPPVRLWSSSAWDSAVASSAVSHMEAEERQRYAVLFSFIRTLRDFNYREYQLASELRTMRRDRAPTDVSRDRLAETVAQLRALNHIMSVAAGQFTEQAGPLHLKFAGDKGAASQLQEDTEMARQCVLPARAT